MCFGYIISTEGRQNGRSVKKNRFLQVKEPDSDTLETYWESLQADDADPNTLTIKPHTISAVHWKPLTSIRSPDTGRPVGSIEDAVSMETMKIDLKGLAKVEQQIWLRFYRKRPDLRPTLYTAQVDCGVRERWNTHDPSEGEYIEKEYKLHCDAERLYFAPADGQQVDDEDEEVEEEVEDEAVRSQNSVRGEIPDSDPEQRRRAAPRKRPVEPRPRRGTGAGRPRKVRKTELLQALAPRRSSRQQNPYDGSSSDEDRESQAGMPESGTHASNREDDSPAANRNLRGGVRKDLPHGDQDATVDAAAKKQLLQDEDEQQGQMLGAPPTAPYLPVSIQSLLGTSQDNSLA